MWGRPLGTQSVAAGRGPHRPQGSLAKADGRADQRPETSARPERQLQPQLLAVPSQQLESESKLLAEGREVPVHTSRWNLSTHSPCALTALRNGPRGPASGLAAEEKHGGLWRGGAGSPEPLGGHSGRGGQPRAPRRPQREEGAAQSPQAATAGAGWGEGGCRRALVQVPPAAQPQPVLL